MNSQAQYATSGVASNPYTTQPISAALSIGSLLSIQMDTIKRLEEVQAKLSASLQPLIKQIPQAQVPPGAEKQSPGPQSPHGVQLANNTAEIELICSSLYELLGLLEV